MSNQKFCENMRFDPATTLFITDLDGTLLTPDAVLPQGAAEMLWELSRRGACVTYLTARTIRSAGHILAGLPFPAPVGLMNGVLLRDMNAERYTESHLLPHETAARLLLLGGEPFVYTLTEDGVLSTAYRNLQNEAMRSFVKERIDRYGKPFRQMDHLFRLTEEDSRIIYFCYLDTEENLRPICRAAEALRTPDGGKAVQCAFYPDHAGKGLWYLEIFAADASKGAACRRLREITGAATVVSFGDNANDLPMFAESDFAFAVEQASEAIRSAADGIVRGGIGIPEFILSHLEKAACIR